MKNLSKNTNNVAWAIIGNSTDFVRYRFSFKDEWKNLDGISMCFGKFIKHFEVDSFINKDVRRK